MGARDVEWVLKGLKAIYLEVGKMFCGWESSAMIGLGKVIGGSCEQGLEIDFRVDVPDAILRKRLFCLEENFRKAIDMNVCLRGLSPINERYQTERKVKRKLMVKLCRFFGAFTLCFLMFFNS